MCYNRPLLMNRIPDLELPVFHPKRSFIRRVIELETRLAYHDRIVKTLPEAFLAPDAKCIPAIAPGPDFEYEDPRKHPIVAQDFAFHSEMIARACLS